MTERTILDMSDEELMALDPTKLEETGVVPAAEVTDTEVNEVQEQVVDTQEVEQDDTNKDIEQQTEEQVAVTSNVEDEKEQESSTTIVKENDVKPVVPAKAEASTNESALDYEAEYKRILAPFKANGREIQPRSVDDAISLMQMGANYQKKMEGLKPSLGYLKLLEDHGLLDKDKLNYLIDLDKKKPEAIQKYMKESGIDPVDLDGEKAKAYTPTEYAVNTKGVELDSVLNDLEGSEHYTQLLDTVGTKWDASSRKVVADTPMILKVIHDHMDRGIYKQITDEVHYQRSLGKLAGVSDLEAYRNVGDMLQSSGAFNGQRPTTTTPTVKTAAVRPATKAAPSEEAKKKMQAASSTRSAPSAPTGFPADFNPLAMSDEELMKMGAPKFSVR